MFPRLTNNCCCVLSRQSSHSGPITVPTPLGRPAAPADSIVSTSVVPRYVTCPRSQLAIYKCQEQCLNSNYISTRPIPEDDLLGSHSSVSSECELDLTQDHLGMSWRSGLVSGTSSRRVVINDTPQPLRLGDKKHRALYSSGRSQHSPPRSILRTPSVKAKIRTTQIASTKKEKARQVDILRVHSNMSNPKIDFPTRKAIQNPFPANTQYKYTMEAISQHDNETKLVSFLKQLVKEFENLAECLASAKEELSQAKIDQSPIAAVHNSLSESLGKLNLLFVNKILAKEEVDYPSIAETLKHIISHLIIVTQSISEQYWKLQEEAHSLDQEKRWLQLGKESLLQEQQELHHVFEVSKAQLLSEKNSITATKLELLKQCKTVENRRPPRGKQKANKLPSKVCDVANDDRERAKHALEMNNLKEANKIAKAELAVAQGTVLKLQQQMEKQHQESQKKTKDLTRRLQQAEETMKLATEALVNDKRKFPDMSMPGKKYGNRLRDVEHTKCKKQWQHLDEHNSEQLWERANRFVKETSQVGRSQKPLPYQSELLSSSRKFSKGSKKTITHSYNKHSTVSQVAKWLTDQHI